jgi:hypothetical protein
VAYFFFAGFAAGFAAGLAAGFAAGFLVSAMVVLLLCPPELRPGRNDGCSGAVIVACSPQVVIPLQQAESLRDGYFAHALNRAR